ncbi:DUF4233 domain-containing protein [Nakamurella flavida]|uniref:DUF4233 domain-containing protein n=1 Tax=Nakamurella flavida TaxID=363630 RepID=A0A938YLV6_9ACTN|nr:DUF4233 domain-containing protein [Nakamurella flavida]MBM9477093.1 DUF4233 domain-containing protein [Nakamurella flavida]MDP9780039.1 Flp pilus assembly protein TadB [Nakamurella flavida]
MTAAAEPAGDETPRRRPADPERGLRGIISATLFLEAIVILLAIPVAVNTGNEVGPLGVVLICVLAVLHIGACAVVSRPWVFTMIFVLQALVIAGWALSGSLGVMGVVFALVWGLILWFRTEFRRRQAAGTLPSQQPPPD